MNGGCPERVWRGSEWTGGYQECGKPIKRRERCGVHARQLDRADARIAESEDARARYAAARLAADDLSGRFGVPFTAERDRVVLGADSAQRLLEIANDPAGWTQTGGKR